MIITQALSLNSMLDSSESNEEMILIRQEMPSINGLLKANTIKNPYKFMPENNATIKGTNVPVDVIWCKFRNASSYPIAYFASRELRDQAYNELTQTQSTYVVLDYNKYFNVSLVTDQIAVSVIKQYKITLSKTIKFAMDRIHNTTNFRQLDAFSGFTERELIDIITKDQIHIDEKYASIWSKCLWVPELVRSNGLSKKQFFEVLIKQARL